MPFTGAFAFVLCPRCRAVIHIARAVRVVPGGAAQGPANYTVPSADAIQAGYVGPPPPVHTVRRVARAATTAGAGVTAYLFLNNLVALLAGVPTGVAYAAATSGGVVPIFVAFPVPFLLLSFGGTAAAVWYVLLVTAIVLSLASLARRHGRDAWAKFYTALRGDGTPSLSEPNALFVLTRLFAMSLFVAFAVDLMASLLGIIPVLPPSLQNPALGDLLVSLAHASVWEELITRVLLLGVPLLLLHYAGRGKLEQPWHRYLVGGRFTLDGPAVSLLVFQAAVFGTAHLWGWDAWKVPSAAVFGLALGYLFLRYGLAACIAMHFLADYLSVSIAMTESTAYPLLVVLAFYFVLAVGIVNTIRYLFVLREVLAQGKVPSYLGGPPEPSALTAPPAAPVEVAPPLEQHPFPPGGRG